MPSLSRLIGLFRLEELICGVFFVILAILSLSEGVFFGSLYLDRLVFFFLILVIGYATVRINICLSRYDGFPLDIWRVEALTIGRWVRDVFNLLMCWSMYMSLSTLMQAPTWRDDWLIAADRFLFRCDPTVWLERFVAPSLTNALAAAYATLFVYIPVLFLVLMSRSDRRALRDFLLGIVIASFFGYLGYVLVPAIGPQFTLADKHTVDLLGQPSAKIAQQALFFLIDCNRIHGDCFPSMHTCLAVLCLLYAWRWSRLCFWVFLPFVASLVFSTVYLRYHYVVDVIAGLALAAACYGSTPKLLTWWIQRTGLSESDL